MLDCGTATGSTPIVGVVTDSFDDDVLRLVYDELADRACLGCLSSGPTDVADGEWVVLLQDAKGRPLGFGHIGLVFDFKEAPIARASEALRHAGYEHVKELVARPWAAEWRIIRPEHRVPG